MLDNTFDQHSIKEIEEEILRVRIGSIDQEKVLCYTLTEKAKLQNDPYALAFSYTFLADYYLAMRENSTAYHYLMTAKQLSESACYEDLLIHIYNFLGMFYYSIYDEVTSMDYHLKSLHYAQKAGNSLSIASSYNNMATCFELKNNYQEAMHYYHKSYDIIKDFAKEYTYFKILSLTNLCSCSYHTKQFHLIPEYLEELKTFSSASVPCYPFILAYCNMLACLFKANQQTLYQAANHFFNEERRIQDPLLVYQIMLNVCSLFLKTRHKKYAEKSIQIIERVNHDQDLKSQKEVQKYKIQFCQLFAMQDQLNKEYAKFYDIIMAMETMEQETRIAGLLAKIELYQTKEKQECLKKEKEELELLMNTDDLTGIRNRRSFNHTFEKLKKETDTTIAIAMLDIDYFKEYNDLYGHHKGDEALITIGQAMKEFINSDIQVYRYGGDEFSIIFENINETHIQQVLNKLTSNILEKKIEHKGSYNSEYLRISYGYAIKANPEHDLDKLLQQADASLYEAKRARKKKIKDL